ncbi:MAG: PaaI family thioesterase [Sedimentitalea sp.]
MAMPSPPVFLSQDELLGLSGLEFLQGMLEGRLAGPPISEAMNYRLHDVSEGRVVFRGAPTQAMTNPLGSVHGGWYGTLLDSAMACAVQSAVPKGALYTTLEYKINITRAIPVDMQIDCIGTIDHVGRSTGVSHGEIRGVDDGRLYATGSTTCLIMTPSGPR